MIMEPTSRDKVERRVVIQEPIPSSPVIGQSLIVVTQAFLIRIPRRRPGE